MNKIAVFYYTQSGQALDIARSICQGMDNNHVTVVYKEIVPSHRFPFPWSGNEFFDAFPESRLGIPPCQIEPIDFSDVVDACLVIVVGQSWFLSPSLPLQAFFLDQSVKEFLSGRKVVFVNGCRNMWLKTLHAVRKYLRECNAAFVGHIVLQDRVANLVSVATIVRWLIYGKREASRLLPRSGVSERDIAGASRFGKTMADAIRADEYSTLQEKLMAQGAIDYKPSILFLEKAGHRMFGLWARFVRQKGGFGDKRRRLRLRLFTAYLLTVLYVVSPFGSLFFWLTNVFRNNKKNKHKDCYEL